MIAFVRLYIHFKPVIMYRICDYVCMHIGRVCVSYVHTMYTCHFNNKRIIIVIISYRVCAIYTSMLHT